MIPFLFPFSWRLLFFPLVALDKILDAILGPDFQNIVRSENLRGPTRKVYDAVFKKIVAPRKLYIARISRGILVANQRTDMVTSLCHHVLLNNRRHRPYVNKT